MNAKSTIYFLCTVLLFTVGLNSPSAALTGEQILTRVDQNLQSDSQISDVSMIIHGRRGQRTIQARAWASGTDQSFVEYLHPARDKGTKMLKLKNELWIYSPNSDRIIKIAGHMLRQSVMGSDLSYEDMMEDDLLHDNYESKVLGEEILHHRICYVLELTAKHDKVAYAKRKIWVDKERFITLKDNRYATSGKLLKTTDILEVQRLKDRWYTKKAVFKDALKQGQGTEFIIDSIQLNADIPKRIFSKASLKK